MNTTISLRFFEIASQFVSTKEEAKEILATKQDIADLRIEIKDTKVDMIKWYVALFVMLALMIVGLYFK
ncbi:MAG: hypothetical protein ACPGTG_06745 [Flavobacteriales bacterium]